MPKLIEIARAGRHLANIKPAALPFFEADAIRAAVAAQVGGYAAECVNRGRVEIWQEADGPCATLTPVNERGISLAPYRLRTFNAAHGEA